MAIRHLKFDIVKKKFLILGAGGVVPSIIFNLQKMGAIQISISNRTKKKAEDLKKMFKNLNILEWGVSINTSATWLLKLIPCLHLPHLQLRR